MQKDRLNAFSVLRKAAKKRSSDPPLSSAKKLKTARPGLGKYEECPVCSRQIPSAFLAEHAARCGLGTQQDGGVATAPASAGIHKHADAKAEPRIAINGSAAQHTPELAADAQTEAKTQTDAALPGDEASARSAQTHTTQLQGPAGGSAFEHILRLGQAVAEVRSCALVAVIEVDGIHRTAHLRDLILLWWCVLLWLLLSLRLHSTCRHIVNSHTFPVRTYCESFRRRPYPF